MDVLVSVLLVLFVNFIQDVFVDVSVDSTLGSSDWTGVIL